MNIGRRHIMLGLLCLGLLSCLDKRDQESEDRALIEQELQRRVDGLIANKKKRCLNEVWAEAGRRADSIFLKEAFLETKRKPKPPKPVRPPEPPPVTVTDTSPIVPLLDLDTVASDSQ